MESSNGHHGSDADAQRIGSATWSLLAEDDPITPRITPGALRQIADIRVDEVLDGLSWEGASVDDIARDLTGPWCEGFMYGLLFVASGPRKPAPGGDYARSMEVHHEYSMAVADGGSVEAAQNAHVSPLALRHAARIRVGHEARRVHAGDVPYGAGLREIVCVTWMDGWTVGAVFQELGGQQEPPPAT
jgi:hypothetical protein